MVLLSSAISLTTQAGTKIKALWRLGIVVLLGSLLILFLVFQPSLQLEPLSFPKSHQASEVHQVVRDWMLRYQDLSQASARHQAFRDLSGILQRYEDAPEAVGQTVLLNQSSGTQMLAVAVGALSSHGTPQDQQALGRMLQASRSNPSKAMLVLPQIMLLEQPQTFLFDELQTFAHQTQNELLQENAELALAGLWQHSARTNERLTKEITLWLEKKKALVLANPGELAHWLDLVGNTANAAFLADILEASTHPHVEVRARAVFALRLFRDEQAVSTLKHQLLVEQNAEVKRKIVEALGYLH